MYLELPIIASIILYIISPFWNHLVYLALIFQGGYIVSRGISLGRFPVVGVHDTLIFLAFSTVLIMLPFHKKIKSYKSFFIIICILATVYSTASLATPPMNSPLPPIIKTVWFELHVVLAFFSYGLFGIGAVLGIIYLSSKEKNIELLQYNAILIGHFIFSISMIFGGIWAYLAWGTYWLWTPKELWTAMLWIFLTLYLHLRYRPWWKKGKGIVLIGIINYFVMLFTYLGVGLLMKSSHSF